jgi:hypothetical protein
VATVCSHCGKELPRGGDARFCTNCGMLVFDHPSESPDAKIVKDDVIPAKNVAPSVSPNVGWREQLADQPSAKPSPPPNPNVTPWLGLPGNDAGNVTPWLGLPEGNAGNVTPWHGISGQDPRDAFPTANTQHGGQEATVPRPEKGEDVRPVREDVPAKDGIPARDQAQPGFYRSTSAPSAPAGGVGEDRSSGPGLGSQEQAPQAPTARPGAARPASNPPSNPGRARRLGAPGRLSRQNVDEQTPAENVAWPDPITHTTVADGKQKNDAPAAQDVFPVLPDTPPVARDINSRVRDDGSAAAYPANPSNKPSANVTPVPEPQIEDFPTSIIASSSIAADQSAWKQNERHDRQPHEDIDQLPTAMLQVREKEQKPVTPGSYPADAQPYIDTSRPGHQRPPVSQPPVAPSNNPAYAPNNAPAVQDTPTVSISGRPFSTQATSAKEPRPLRAPRKSGRSLLFAIAAIIIVVALGIGSWIVLAQPFTVPTATNPIQQASNVPLGVSIAYPAGWGSTQTSTTLTLADSSHTAQMKIAQPDAATATDPAAYLKQEATTLGMTDAKDGSPVSFAGSNWQQTHGDFVVDGAGYTGTIYATTHNNHMYTLIQMAPKVTFQDEESLVFAPSRVSLQFGS